MKLAILVNKSGKGEDRLSPHFRRAQYVVEYDTDTNEKKEEGVNALTGRDLVDKIQEMQPGALIIPLGVNPPALRFLDTPVYGAKAGLPLETVVEQYSKGELQGIGVLNFAQARSKGRGIRRRDRISYNK